VAPRNQAATTRAAALLGSWAATAAARPRRALAGIALLVLGALLAASSLTVDTDSSRMLAPDLAFQSRVHELNEAFPEIKNSVIVALRGPSADPVDAATAALAAELAGHEDITAVFAPAVDPFFLTHGLLYQDAGALDRQLTRLGKSANLLAALRADRTLAGFLEALDAATRLAERATTGTAGLAALHREAAAVFRAAAEGEARPFGWRAALSGESPGAVLRLITVTPKLDYTALKPAGQALASIEAAIAALPGETVRGVEIGVTGEPALRAEEFESVISRLGLSLGLSLALVAVVLWLALGTLARTGLAVVSLLVTLILTGGFAALAVGALNLISIAFVVLMVGLGIDFAIHFMAHLDERARQNPPDGAILATARTLGPALALTASSTALGFLAFATTEFHGMAQLGLIGGVGVMIALAVTLTLIPAVVALSPRLALGRARGRLPVPEGPGRVVPWLALALGLAAAGIATEARFDADPMALRDPEARSVAVYDWLVADPDTHPLTLNLIAETRERAAREAERLAALPEVAGTVWLGDLAPANQAAKLALIDLSWPSIEHAVAGEPTPLVAEGAVTLGGLARRLRDKGPAAQALAAAMVAYAETRTEAADAALEAALFRYFPALIDRLEHTLAVDRVGVGDLPAPLLARYRSDDGRLRVEIRPAADITEPPARHAFVEAVTAAAPEAAGPPAQIEGAAGAVAGAMIQASLIALAATALIAFLALGRGILVLAILAPVALAAAVTMAASVLLAIPFNYANIIVLPLLIGIGVDSGVHLALRTAAEARVFATSTPRAVAYSALTTIGAFATLGLSEHRGTASMGIMLAIALVAAVAMAFALTPALIRIARARGGL